MFTCCLSSLLGPPAHQVGGKKLLLHALEDTSLIPHELQECLCTRAQGGGRKGAEVR